MFFAHKTNDVITSFVNLFILRVDWEFYIDRIIYVYDCITLGELKSIYHWLRFFHPTYYFMLKLSYILIFKYNETALIFKH